MRVDFHCHSQLSDGVEAVTDLVERGRRQGLVCWSITDHDCLAVYDQPNLPETLVPGVEVTAWAYDREVHIVGLGVDISNTSFQDFLAGIRAKRDERMQDIIQDLNKRGVLIAAGAGKPATSLVSSRSHLAQALLAAKKVSYIGAAFRDFIGDGHLAHLPEPAYPSPAVAAEAIQAAGGVAILAHPGIYQDIHLVERLLACGLDGAETSHPGLNFMAQPLTNMVQKKGLLESCGSDFHYPGRRELGDAALPAERLRPLMERLGRPGAPAGA